MDEIKILSRDTACVRTDLDANKLKTIADELHWIRGNTQGGAPPLSFWERRALETAVCHIEAILAEECV